MTQTDQLTYTRQQAQLLAEISAPHEATINLLKKYNRHEAIIAIRDCIESELRGMEKGNGAV